MKKYCLVPYFFLFWCVADLFLSPADLILTAGAAAILLLILLPKKRMLRLSLAAAVALGMGFFNVQFLLRCFPALLLVLAHTEAEALVETEAKKKDPHPDGVYTAVLLCVAASLAGLVFDIAAFARLPVPVASTRLCWALAGTLLFVALLSFFGRHTAGHVRKKTEAVGRRAYGAARLVYICACACAAAAGAGCVLNAAVFGEHNVVFSWLIFLAAAAGTGDAVQSAAGERLKGLFQKLFSGSE